MGIAEVIPGVSGGTIAFITGIYEELISSIKAFGPEAIQAWRKGGSNGLWTAINGKFLIFLMIGMGFGFISGVFVISGLIENHPEKLWGFFFGLILASCLLIGFEIKSWNLSRVLALIGGTIFAYTITTVAPAEGSLNLVYVYVSAVIAISALMLPGVSGSFMLLIMGMYTLIIPTIKRFLVDFSLDDFIILSVFGLGALTGLAIFSRVLTYLFNKHKSISFAVLTGFMLGSLNKIWPWRNISSVLEKEAGTIINIQSQDQLLEIGEDNYKILSEENVMPSEYLFGNPDLIGVLISFLAGILVVYFLHKLNKK